MARKNLYCHKWDTTILEQVAHDCAVTSKARTMEDWEIFLTAIYKAIDLLTSDQRVVLLLSQEIGLSYVDIARIMGKPLSTVVGLLKQAINKITFVIKSRSVSDDRYNCQALTKLFAAQQKAASKEVLHEPPEFEFIDKLTQPVKVIKGD